MGTRDSELKEAILEFVKGNDNKITMAIMTEVSKTRTTINVSKKLASKKAQALKVSFTSPLSKEKGGSSGSGTDKGSGSGKNKKQEFVNFDKLDGEERLEAIKHLSLHVYCGNHTDHKKTKCVERNHICQKLRSLTILKKYVVTWERKMLLARQLLSLSRGKETTALKIQAKQMWKRTLIDMRLLLTTLMSAACECVWSEDLIPKSFNHISKTLTIPRS